MVKRPGSDSGTLQVLHGITQLAVPAFCKRTFACMGDIQKGHIETVEFAKMLLDITGEVRVFEDAQRQAEAFAAAMMPRQSFLFFFVEFRISNVKRSLGKQRSDWWDKE